MRKYWTYNNFLFLCYFTVASFYIGWRFQYTLGWHSVFAPLMFVSDLILIANSMIYLYTSRNTYIAPTVPALKNKTVDIFIPTYNEPHTIVLATVESALAVKGVRNVFLLDDGNRAELRIAVEKMGTRYLTRNDKRFAKAGNMNFGLQHSDAEFVAFFDCDHMPLSSFIKETLGYFKDDKLAFVQTPQTFYNIDSIQHRKTRRRPTWNEQTMFYDAIQPSKNSFNAAFFCGTSALLRRSAIDSVGGFSTNTATEDIHTSIRMHAQGWKSLFLPKRLAFGLAPEDMMEYHKQRVRWGAGSLGLLFRSKDSPLWIRGLSFKQRLSYFHSTFAHMMGFYKLMYILMPVVTIFFIQSQAGISLESYFAVHILFVIFSYYITMKFSQWTFHFPYTEQFDIFNIMPQIEAFKGVIKVQKKFSVSVKSKVTKNNNRAFLFFGSLLLLTLIAEIYGIAHIIMYDETSLYISLLWNGLNAFFLVTVLYYLVTRSRMNQRNLIPLVQAIEVRSSPKRPAIIQGMSATEVLLDLPNESAKSNIKVILSLDGKASEIDGTLQKVISSNEQSTRAYYTLKPQNAQQRKELTNYFLHKTIADFFQKETDYSQGVMI